ncbi:MAG: PKD domain-containing protein, partial [Phaeodactylibacter sp.]|nr:PKD domain-containing protein [Phaeodactylibacter sp.]
TVTSSTSNAQAGVMISFDADVEDAEGEALDYEWQWGDGTTTTGSIPAGPGVRSLPTEMHAYGSNGIYTATLVLSDASHTTTCTSLEIQIGTPPVATITAPADGLFFRAGDVINFTGTGTDADGPITAADYTWEVRFLHNGHYHPEYGPVSGMTSGSFAIPTSGHDFTDNTSFEITLTITDQDGLTDVDQVIIFPDKVDVTYQSVPSGLVINIDGIPRITPFVLDDLIDFERTLSVSNTQCLGGDEYTFDNWSNGNPATHTITVPATNTTLTVTYTMTGECAAPVTNGLVLQLDGSLGVTLSGSEVMAWADQSGSGNDLSPVGAAPELQSGMLNGHDVVSFNGIDESMGRSGFFGLPTGSGDRSVFMVTKYNSNGWGGFSYGNNSSNQTFGLGVSNQGKLAIQGWGGSNDFPSAEDGDTDAWLTQAIIVESDQFDLYKDGSIILNQPHAWNTASNKVRLGVEIDDTPFIVMDVAEFLVYDRAVNETERQTIEAYFQSKYFPLGGGPTVSILSPTEGEVITGTEATISWSSTGTIAGDHVHLIVDGQLPHITIMMTNGSYTVTGLSPGAHSFQLSVANSNHVVYTNPGATQTVNFSTQAGVSCDLITNGLVLHVESDINVSTGNGTEVTGWLDLAW